MFFAKYVNNIGTSRKSSIFTKSNSVKRAFICILHSSIPLHQQLNPECRVWTSTRHTDVASASTDILDHHRDARRHYVILDHHRDARRHYEINCYTKSATETAALAITPIIIAIIIINNDSSNYNCHFIFFLTSIFSVTVVKSLKRPIKYMILNLF